MDHFVKIDRIPDGFEFPAEIQDRIHFDAEHHQLVFHGYMSKTEFDHMCQRTTDWKFRRTLEELFCECVPEESVQPRGIRRLLDALTRRFVSG